VDTVVVDRNLSFNKIAKVLNVDINLIRDLNPSYKNDFIPADNAKMLLRLPAAKAYAFVSLKDSIFKPEPKTQIAVSQDSNSDNKDQTATTSDQDQSKTAENKVNQDEGAPREYTKAIVWYTVKSGDYLSNIADWYDVSIYSIRRWNGLRSNRVAIGRKLKIEVPEEKRSYYKRINNMTALQKRNLNKEEIIEETTIAKKQVKEKEEEPVKKVAETKKPDRKAHVEYYVIQKGDTLWSIAQRFPGVTVADIMRANGIKDNHSIRVGQKIKIEKG
jgi:membrane-bound lytic murein transglycosylase D